MAPQATDPASDTPGPGPEPRLGTRVDGLPERRAILRSALGIGVYAGAFGATFGAVSIGSGLTIPQTMALSLVMFSGASQFAFVGVIATGGSPFAAIPSALLLAVRNAFYGVPVTRILRPSGRARVWTAHFVIDETTAMAVAQETAAGGRYAFWATGIILCALWNLGTLAGALIGTGVNTSELGLGAAAPAIFLALLWPHLRMRRARRIALLGGLVAFVMIPLAPAGVPVIAAAAVAVVAGVRPDRASTAAGALPERGHTPS